MEDFMDKEKSIDFEILDVSKKLSEISYQKNILSEKLEKLQWLKKKAIWEKKQELEVKDISKIPLTKEEKYKLCMDYRNGMTIEELQKKYGKLRQAIIKVINGNFPLDERAMIVRQRNQIRSDIGLSPIDMKLY